MLPKTSQRFIRLQKSPKNRIYDSEELEPKIYIQTSTNALMGSMNVTQRQIAKIPLEAIHAAVTLVILGTVDSAQV